jgi:lipopolysaccharide biosynthesis glycosyltransferase
MITVAFVHVGQDGLLPSIMVATVRRAMPRARIVQLTDETTAPVAHVHDIIRAPYDGKHLMTFRLAHFAQLEPCNAVFLDTDVMVQKDLEPLFDWTFDVALTIREGAIPDPHGVDVTASMPYNTGVMLSKPEGWEFWEEASKHCETLPDDARRWWGDQFSVKTIAEVIPLCILDLPCDIYNYTPSSETEDLSDRFVVHYKGQRKPWMIRRGPLEFGPIPPT